MFCFVFLWHDTWVKPSEKKKSSLSLFIIDSNCFWVRGKVGFVYHLFFLTLSCFSCQFFYSFLNEVSLLNYTFFFHLLFDIYLFATTFILLSVLTLFSYFQHIIFVWFCFSLLFSLLPLSFDLVFFSITELLSSLALARNNECDSICAIHWKAL